MGIASERGRYKLLRWSSLSVVHPFEYDAYCILFPIYQRKGFISYYWAIRLV